MRRRKPTPDELLADRAKHSPAPMLPRRIALIDIDAGKKKTATSFILDDFEEAFSVYAHHDADPEASIPELIRTPSDRTFSSDTRELHDIDTIVLGCSLNASDSSDRLRALLSNLSAAHVLTSDARAYMIASDTRYEPENAKSTFSSFENLWLQAGASWCGGLAAYASALIPATAHMARMGMARRRLSEATDRLILTVRCGTGAGTIVVPAPVPRFIYRLVANNQTGTESPLS